jgi:type I restriction enzyme S subunit
MTKPWERAPLDEAVFLQEGPGIRSYEYQKGGYPMINVRCVQDGYIDLSTCNAANVELATGKWKHFQVQEGDILFTISGSIGRTAIVKKEDLPLLMNTSVVRFRSKTPRLRDDFFFYYLQSEDFLGKLHALSSGTAQKNVGPTHLKTLDVPLPLLPEQQRIVGLLDEAFAGLATAKANAEKNLQNARALFESHLQSVFAQRGKGWVETTLEKVLAVQPQNGWSPPAANHSDSGTPVLTLSSVTGFRFRPDKLKFTSASTDSRRNYWVKNGDFLITRSNTPDLVGHVAIASGIHKPTIYPDLIMRMNPLPDRMMTEFLYYQMRSPALRKEIMGRAQGANPTMKKISNGAVKTLPIAVPPIATQRSIVKTLNGLTEETQRLASLYERKLAALEALKKSLLHQAFTGEL